MRIDDFKSSEKMFDHSKSSISLGSILEDQLSAKHRSSKGQESKTNNINNRHTKKYSATPPLTRAKKYSTSNIETKAAIRSMYTRSYSVCNLRANNSLLGVTIKEKRGGSLRSSKVSLSPLKTSTSFSSFCSEKRHGSIQHSALNIQGVMTWVSFILPALKDKSDTVILVIPGNPGAIEFYDRFIEQLYQDCGMPIFGISHAGHNLIPSKSSLVRRMYKELNPGVKRSDKHVFTLEEQIDHKLAFIREHVDPKKKIIILAHSLGSYVTLKMMEKLHADETKRIKQIVLLFPVFERTMETQSGRKWVPITQLLENSVVRTTKLIERLPPNVKTQLVQLIATKRKFSKTSKKSLASGIASLVTPNGLRNMSQIARDLSKIGKIENLENVITESGEKLTFYYGAGDLWTPLSFYQEMRTRFPNIDIRLDVEGIAHAFVLNHSSIMAPVVSEIIRNKIIMDGIGESGSVDSYRDMFCNFGFKRSQLYKSRGSFRNKLPSLMTS